MSQNTKKPYNLPDWPAEAEQTQEAPRPRRKRRAPAEPEDLWGKLRFRAGKKVRWFGRRCRRVVREAQAHRFPESNRKPLQFLLMLWGLLPPLPAGCGRSCWAAAESGTSAPADSPSGLKRKSASTP